MPPFDPVSLYAASVLTLADWHAACEAFARAVHAANNAASDAPPTFLFMTAANPYNDACAGALRGLACRPWAQA